MAMQRLLQRQRRKHAQTTDMTTPLLGATGGGAAVLVDDEDTKRCCTPSRELSVSPNTVIPSCGMSREEQRLFSFGACMAIPLARQEHRIAAAAEIRRFAALFWHMASSGAVPIGSEWYVKSTEATAWCGYEPCVDPDNVLVTGAMIVRYMTRELSEMLVTNDREEANRVLCGAAGVASKLCTRLESIEEMRRVSCVVVQAVFGEAHCKDPKACTKTLRRCEFDMLAKAPTASCAYCNPVDEFDAWLCTACRDALVPHDVAMCHSVASVLALSMMLVYDTCDCELILGKQPFQYQKYVFFEAVCAVASEGVSTAAARRALTFRCSEYSWSAATLLQKASSMVEEGFKMGTMLLRVRTTDRLVKICSAESMMNASNKLSRKAQAG